MVEGGDGGRYDTGLGSEGMLPMVATVRGAGRGRAEAAEGWGGGVILC